MSAEPIFKSLTEQVYDFLSISIIEGRITPHEKLLELKLCKDFGISRTPLRECFRLLESDGLVTINPRKGTFVKQITFKDIEDAFWIRVELEGLAARLAVPNLGDKDLEIFEELIERMGKAIFNNDIRAYVRLNFNFHSQFIKASNNTILEKTLRTLGKGLWLRIAYIYYQSPSALNSSNEMHKKILKGFRKRDVVYSEKMVRRHITDAMQGILKAIPRD